MAVSFGKVSKRVFSIVKGGGRSVVMFDEVGNKVYNPENARRFFVKPEHIMVTVKEDSDESEIKIALHEGIDITSIQRLLNDLRLTAVHFNLKYTVRKFGHEIQPKHFAYQAEIEKENMMKEHVISEKMNGYKKTSYQKIGDCRLVVRHTSPIDENKIGARGRNILSVYVENKLGERFMMPFAHVNGGRAMARHLSEGGTLEDSIGVAIKNLMIECNNLRGVSRYISENIKSIGHNENTQEYRDMIRERLIEINNRFKAIIGSRGYNESKESLTETDELDHDLIQKECDTIIEHLRIEEGNDPFVEGINALARHSIRKKSQSDEEMLPQPIIDEPTLGDDPTVGDIMFGEFNEWIDQFSLNSILKENDPSFGFVNNEEQEEKPENKDLFYAEQIVNVIPTPSLNRSVYSEANWIKQPTKVMLLGDIERGTLDIVEVEHDKQKKMVYGFNISGISKDSDKVKESKQEDNIWEAAASLVKWRSNPDKIKEITEGVSKETINLILKKVTDVWMETISNDLRNIIETVSSCPRSHPLQIKYIWKFIPTGETGVSITKPDQYISLKSFMDEMDRWNIQNKGYWHYTLADDDAEVTDNSALAAWSLWMDKNRSDIKFENSVDMVVGTKRILKNSINFDVDYESMKLKFENYEDCKKAAEILKENNIRCEIFEDVYGGDMGDAFKRSISSEFDRKNPRDDTTPKFTGFPYKVGTHDVNNLMNILSDAGIEFSLEGEVFHFGSEEDRERAIDMHHPNDIDRGIVGEMSSMRNKIIQLSDYRK